MSNRLPRPPIRRRMVLGGLGAAGLAGSAAVLYRAAPGYWEQFRRERNRPVLPAPHRPDPALWPNTGIHAAWLGHTTVLLKVDGFTILTDPVLGTYCGINLGIGTLGIKRLVAPALSVSALPPVDLILLSHAHMDHFDTYTLRQLETKRTAVITARRTSDLLRASRYAQVCQLGWGEEHQAGPVLVRGLEVNHWGARYRTDNYRGYNGYLLQAGRYRILFGGDTAETRLFAAARTSRPIDVAIMPIGAYNPWIRYHCTPEQAWRMAQEAGAERILPVHHQTFSLSREPVLEPIDRLREAAGERVVVREIGEQIHIV